MAVNINKVEWGISVHSLQWEPNEAGAVSGFDYTGCHRRNVKYFGRVFLMLNYTDIT